jgi:hypothetical protein
MLSVYTLLLCYLSGVKCLSPVASDSINLWEKPMGGLRDDEEIFIAGMSLPLKPASYIVLKSITVPYLNKRKATENTTVPLS